MQTKSFLSLQNHRNIQKSTIFLDSNIYGKVLLATTHIFLISVCVRVSARNERNWRDLGRSCVAHCLGNSVKVRVDELAELPTSSGRSCDTAQPIAVARADADWPRWAMLSVTSKLKMRWTRQVCVMLLKSLSPCSPISSHKE